MTNIVEQDKLGDWRYSSTNNRYLEYIEEAAGAVRYNRYDGAGNPINSIGRMLRTEWYFMKKVNDPRPKSEATTTAPPPPPQPVMLVPKCRICQLKGADKFLKYGGPIQEDIRHVCTRCSMAYTTKELNNIMVGT